MAPGRLVGLTGGIGSGIAIMVVIAMFISMIESVVGVLGAGGVGNGRQVAAALALGCAGVWTGSLWLTVTEADNEPAQKEDRKRTRLNSSHAP